MASKNIYGKPIDDSYGSKYDSYHEHHVHGYMNEPAVDDCTDQLPLFAQVGRGLSGDSFKVEIKEDSDRETYLEGSSYDQASKKWTSEWVTENINGGHLGYAYNIYPESSPQGFTITFTYSRPGRAEWEWTTPIIPFIADSDEAAQEYYAEGLSKILSIPKDNIIWLLQNKEAPVSGTDGVQGVHGTGKDLMDWIDDELANITDSLDDLKDKVDSMDTSNETIIQQYIENKFLEEIIDQQKVYSGDNDSNELGVYWVICYSPLINLCVIKATSYENPTLVLGQRYYLTTDLNLNTTPMPTYCDQLVFPFAFGQYWDSSAQTILPCTVYLVFGIYNKSENRGGLWLICYPNDYNRDYPNPYEEGVEGYSTGAIHLDNSLVFFNNYDKENGVQFPSSID